MFRKLFLPLFLVAHVALGADSLPNAKAPTVAVPESIPPLNAAVLQAIQAMPRDGGYSTTSVTATNLSEAIVLLPRGLKLEPTRAVPSYCSGATYLVFMQVVQTLLRDRQLSLERPVLEALLITGQRDGVGIWGRWNANGPGTPRLFHELGLGRNFTAWDEALPGDFLKIFWTNEIGKRERGHSVIFTGFETEGGVDYVRFWSSNQPRGYHEKRVTRKSIALAIFSRLERPANLAGAATLPRRDDYLANLLTERSTMTEVRAKCGL